MKYRRDTKALQTGKLMQFVPDSGIYVYFRYDAEKTIMVLINNNKEGVKQIETQHYAERILDFTKGKNIVTGETIDLKGFEMKAKSVLVLELEK